MGDVRLCSCPCSGSDLERETRTEGKRSFCSNPLGGSGGGGSRLGGPCMQMSRTTPGLCWGIPRPVCPSGSPSSAGPSSAGCDMRPLPGSEVPQRGRGQRELPKGLLCRQEHGLGQAWHPELTAPLSGPSREPPLQRAGLPEWLPHHSPESQTSQPGPNPT